MSAETSAKGNFTKTPSLFKAHGIYYFKKTVNGKRKTYSTGKTAEIDAIMEEKRMLAAMFPQDEKEPIDLVPKTLFQLLRLFANEETRPKPDYGMPTVTYRYVHLEAKNAKQMIEVLPESLLSIPLSKLTKQDIKSCRTALISGCKPVSTPNRLFCTLRRIIGKAYDMEWLMTNVIDGIQAPPRNCGKRDGILLENVRDIVANKAIFNSEEERCAYYIVATTGMRKSEFMAIQPGQVKHDDNLNVWTLDISQAFKDSAFKTVGLPKCSKKRIIPLAPTTAEYLNHLLDVGKDKEFPMKQYFYPNLDRKQKEIWDRYGSKFTLHQFRHSLESALIINNANPYLAGEYISWNGQDMSKVQYGYTHVFVKSLMEISSLIEKLFQG